MNEQIRNYRDEDLDWLYRLNESNTPEVGELTEAEFKELLGLIEYCRLVFVDDKPAGFLMAMVPGIDYQSANYRWFSERYDQFLYCDRIVIDSSFRGQGLGRLLYDDMKEEALKRKLDLCLCEINERPPNPKSMAFHQKIGFSKNCDFFKSHESKRCRHDEKGSSLMIPYQEYFEKDGSLRKYYQVFQEKTGLKFDSISPQHAALSAPPINDELALFPFPLVLDEEEYQSVSKGVKQRGRALTRIF